MTRLIIEYVGSGLNGASNTCGAIVNPKLGAVVGRANEVMAFWAKGNSNLSWSFKHDPASLSVFGYAMGAAQTEYIRASDQQKHALFVASNVHANNDRRGGPLPGVVVSFNAGYLPESPGPVIDLLYEITSAIRSLTTDKATGAVNNVLKEEQLMAVLRQPAIVEKIKGINIVEKQIADCGYADKYECAYTLPHFPGENVGQYQTAMNSAAENLLQSMLDGSRERSVAVMAPRHAELLQDKRAVDIRRYPRPQTEARTEIAALPEAGQPVSGQARNAEFQGAGSEVSNAIDRHTSTALFNIRSLVQFAGREGPDGDKARAALQQIVRQSSLPTPPDPAPGKNSR